MRVHRIAIQDTESVIQPPVARPPGFEVTQFRETQEDCGTLPNCYVCPNGGAQAPNETEALFDSVLKLRIIPETGKRWRVTEVDAGKKWNISFEGNLEQRLAAATKFDDIKDFASHNFNSDVIGGPWVVTILHRLEYSTTKGGFLLNDEECAWRHPTTLAPEGVHAHHGLAVG